MMPADIHLPCTEPHHRATFDVALSFTDRRTAGSVLTVIAAAKAVCAGCDHVAACLRENPDAAGIVGGMTAGERAAAGIGGLG